MLRNGQTSFDGRSDAQSLPHVLTRCSHRRRERHEETERSQSRKPSTARRGIPAFAKSRRRERAGGNTAGAPCSNCPIALRASFSDRLCFSWVHRTTIEPLRHGSARTTPFDNGPRSEARSLPSARAVLANVLKNLGHLKRLKTRHLVIKSSNHLPVSAFVGRCSLPR
jgi:hypothetical protein